jgi:alpha-L-fucosidase
LGLKVGLYYTGPDWYFDQDYMSFLYHGARRNNPEFPPLGPDLRPRIKEATSEALKKHQEAYAELVKGQVEELLTNYGKIDLIWFDGKPNVPNADQVITQKRIRELQPGIVINPRMHGTGDFITYERHLPDNRPEDIRWAEFCNPWNGNWPYVKRPYKALGNVLGELVTSRAWGINYLLGIGPMASGDLAPEAYDNMLKLGDWMKLNHEAINHVRPLPDNEESSVLSSANGNKRYLYLLPKFKENGTSDKDLLPNEDIVVILKGISEPSNVVFMADGRKLKYDYSEEKSQVAIEISATERSNLVDVICISLP